MKTINDFFNNIAQQEIQYYTDARQQRFTELAELNTQELTQRERFHAKQNIERKYRDLELYYQLPIESDEIFNSNMVKLTTESIEKRKQQFIKKIETKGGQIIDATELHIGFNGMVNGLVKCENKTLEVNTVPAGGHNIQRFHFRTLIK